MGISQSSIDGVRMVHFLNAFVVVSITVLSRIDGGCSFSGQEGKHLEKLRDLAAAKFAAKMALAHQGVDLEISKERNERSVPYVPTFETKSQEIDEELDDVNEVDRLEDDDIWSLSERSNSKNKKYYDNIEVKKDKEIKCPFH